MKQKSRRCIPNRETAPVFGIREIRGIRAITIRGIRDLTALLMALMPLISLMPLIKNSEISDGTIP